jgi:hypothetical protein
MTSLYGSQVPRHVGFALSAALSHNLQGVSAYDAGDHWHYVSYGMSELYVPRPEDDPALSGWGFEFSFRLIKSGQPESATWPFLLLNSLANDANSREVFYGTGSRIDVGRAITGYPDVEGAPFTDRTVLAVTVDPQLPERATPNGALAFHLLVGITEATKQAMVQSTTASVLADMTRSNPLLVTTLS